MQQYSYGRSDHCIEDEDFKPAYYEAGLTAIKLGSLLKQMFWILPLTKSLPVSLIARILPDFSLTLNLQNVCHYVPPMYPSNKSYVESQDPS